MSADLIVGVVVVVVVVVVGGRAHSGALACVRACQSGRQRAVGSAGPRGRGSDPPRPAAAAAADDDDAGSVGGRERGRRQGRAGGDTLGCRFWGMMWGKVEEGRETEILSLSPPGTAVSPCSARSPTCSLPSHSAANPPRLVLLFSARTHRGDVS